MDSACSSPTRLAELTAMKNAFFMDLSSACTRGSKSGEDKASSTRDRSNAGILGFTGGRSLLATLWKEDISLWPPTVEFPIGVCRNEIAAT